VLANPKHVAKLKEGAEAWNEWRIEEFNVEPDLSEADLRGAESQWGESTCGAPVRRSAED